MLVTQKVAMSIKYAILGFLSWQPYTGYELKKLFAESDTLSWQQQSDLQNSGRNPSGKPRFVGSAASAGQTASQNLHYYGTRAGRTAKLVADNAPTADAEKSVSASVGVGG
jgi:hypothetical protein